MGAAIAMHKVPPLFLPILHWILPECRALRKTSKEIIKSLSPEVKRKLENYEYKPDRRDIKVRVPVSLDWLSSAARDLKIENYNMVGGEFSLTTSNIRNVGVNVFAGLMRLAIYPEYVEPLRREIIDVLQSTTKLDKAALFRMRRLDSFLKESARHDSFPTTLRRLAMRDTKFSDGTIIPKDTHCMIAPVPMKNAEIYGQDENQFDGFRYMKLRESAIARGSSGEQYQYCSTGNDDTVFGTGVHVCPARFLATFEVKIIVAYMLLHYDFLIPPGEEDETLIELDYDRYINDGRKIWYRIRQPEVDWKSKATW
ncbi:putative ent-kaurene oxidase [Colletotrichum sublineola]|uniref:Putative ent-kaurene oxidase n=1 Tax=Colletotrichum sublineola TaxID=1173701 RepID=A0A066XK42_COLSU|nr:putative ent-kaurene oxidase [Colletotrichum sublineola]